MGVESRGSTILVGFAVIELADFEAVLRDGVSWAALTVLVIVFGLVIGFCLAGFAVVRERGALFLASRVIRPSIDLFPVIIYNYSMSNKKLTKKQLAVVEFIEDFTEENAITTVMSDKDGRKWALALLSGNNGWAWTIVGFGCGGAR